MLTRVRMHVKQWCSLRETFYYTILIIIITRGGVRRLLLRPMSYAADLKALRDRAGPAESYRFEQPSAGNSFAFRHVWLTKHTPGVWSFAHLPRTKDACKIRAGSFKSGPATPSAS